MSQRYYAGRDLPPEDDTNERKHRQALARGVRSAMRGQSNNTMSVTLDANVPTTTIVDPRISISTALVMTPVTAHAAAEMASGNLWVEPPVKETAVIHHTNSVQSDRTFQVALVG